MNNFTWFNTVGDMFNGEIQLDLIILARTKKDAINISECLFWIDNDIDYIAVTSYRDIHITNELIPN